MVNARRRVGAGDRRRGGRDGGVARPARGDAVDRQLDAELAAALDRGGIADLGRAQAVGRRLVLGAGGGRSKRPRSPLPTPAWRSTTASRPPRRRRRSSRASGCRTGGRTVPRRWPRAPRRCSPPETATGRAPRVSPRPRPPPSPGPLSALRARPGARPRWRSRGGRAGVRRGERRRACVSRFPGGASRGSARPRQRRPGAPAARGRDLRFAWRSACPAPVGRGRAGRARQRSPPRGPRSARAWRPPAINRRACSRGRSASAGRETEPRRAPMRRAPRASSPTSRAARPGGPVARAARRRRPGGRPVDAGPSAGGGGDADVRLGDGGGRARTRPRRRAWPAHARRIRKRRCSSAGGARGGRRRGTRRGHRRARSDGARPRQRTRTARPAGRAHAAAHLTGAGPEGASRLSTTRCRPTSTASPRSSPAISSRRRSGSDTP